jgi:RNA polymerase sigma-70 factor (ECF subfamily)
LKHAKKNVSEQSQGAFDRESLKHFFSWFHKKGKAVTEVTGPTVVYRSAPEEFAKGQLALMEDHELVTRALTGQDMAFEVLLDRYSPLVSGILYRKTSCRSDAEDLAQEVFLAAYRGLRQLRTSDRFKGWLMRILHSKLVDYYRRNSRRPQIVTTNNDPEWEEKAGPLDQAAEPSANPRERLRLDEMRNTILGEISQMNDKYRFILYLRLIGEQSIEEIAQRLQLRPSSARMRLFRGMKILRKALKKFDMGF